MQELLSQISGPLSYTVSIKNQEHRRHIDQLKKRVRKENDRIEISDEFMQISSAWTNAKPTGTRY